jgi:hypothetical protein
MDWIAEYIKEKQFATVKTIGEFTVEDHARMVEDIVSQDFWEPGLDVLFDHRNLHFGFTTVEIMKRASANHERNDERIGDGKAAILMKSVVDFGRGRQFELVAADRVSAKLKVFMDEQEAVDWLLENKPRNEVKSKK